MKHSLNASQLRKILEYCAGKMGPKTSLGEAALAVGEWDPEMEVAALYPDKFGNVDLRFK
ncbi:MAG: hypothetical protein NT157_03925 [Candidatus Micrarchaeota archaeon]|nr:hypothetical protein [Candidatus Micrarchaeota archaeon]